MAKICLLMLCGLPGSGKTHLAKFIYERALQECKQTCQHDVFASDKQLYCCKIVTYDQLLPLHIERQLIADENVRYLVTPICSFSNVKINPHHRAP